MKVIRRDIGKSVTLGKRNFIAPGGEGKVYADGEYCIKIYHDPGRMIPEGKIKELAEIASPNVMAPLDIVLQGPHPVGYVMRAARSCLPLPQVFPRGWRDRKGFTPDVALRLVLSWRAAWVAIHAKGALGIDMNEMNFLLRDDFSALVHIDVDSYQTSNYPATAIVPSVRDPQHATFSQGTDWYSFALLSFALLVGAHPFKGRLSGYSPRDLLRRMKDGASALQPGAKLPPTCLPLDVLPKAWRAWFETILHTSERPLPPNQAGDWKMVAVQVNVSAGNVILTRICRIGTRHYLATGRTPRGVKVGIKATSEVGMVDVIIADSVRTQRVRADEISSIDGRIYLRAGEGLLELRYVELGKVKAVPHLVGSVSAHGTKLFRGVAIQNLLGAVWASILPRPGRCTQVRLAEIEGARLVDARFAGGGGKDGRTGVLRVAVDRQGQLELHTWSGLTRSGFDHHLSEDVDVASVEVAELDTGVAVVAHPEGLLLFHPGKPQKTKIIKDPRLAGHPISAEAGTLMVEIGQEAYSVKLEVSQIATNSPGS